MRHATGGANSLLQNKEMRILNKMRAAVVIPAIALALASAGVMGPTASAATSCPSDEVCLYKDINFSGPMYVVPKITLSNGVKTSCVNDLAGKKFSDGTPADNQASSVKNNTDSALILNQHAETAGIYSVVSGGGSVADLRVAPAPATSGTVDLNDRVSRAC